VNSPVLGQFRAVVFGDPICDQFIVVPTDM